MTLFYLLKIIYNPAIIAPPTIKTVFSNPLKTVLTVSLENEEVTLEESLKSGYVKAEASFVLIGVGGVYIGY
jgi:hypothetical protein